MIASRLTISLFLAAAGAPGSHDTSSVPVRPGMPADLIWMVGPGDPAPAKRPPVTAALKARGSLLYRSRCSVCHGEQGDGNGILANRLLTRPTDFRRGLYKLRSTPAGTLPTDEDLYGTLTRGLHGTNMQPWRELRQADRWALVAHLKSLSPRFDQEVAGRPVLVPTPPRETGALREQGERLYVWLRCGVCHGEQGQGDGLSGGLQRAEQNPDLRVRDFTRGRFLRGAEMEDIYVTLLVGIEGTPMGSYVALKQDELWALAAYVRDFVRERPLHELPPARRK